MARSTIQNVSASAFFKWASVCAGIASTLTFGASDASAHGVNEALAGAAPLYDASSGTLSAAGASYGLLTHDGASWRWAPEEILGSVPRAWMRRPADDAILAGTGDGLWTSTDGGCSWTLGALRDASINALSVVPGQPDRWLAALEAARGEGGIFESLDAGRTWQPTGIASPFINTSEVLALTDRWWATGFNRSVQRHFIWSSDDEGLTWVAPDGGTFNPIRLLGADPEGRVYTSTETTAGTWTLARLRPSGQQDAVLGTFDIPLEGFSWDLDAPLVLTGEGEVLRISGGPPVREDVPAASCLDQQSPTGTLWICTDTTVAAHNFMTKAPGAAAWTPTLAFDAVFPQTCPAGSTSAMLIEQLWPTLQAMGLGSPFVDDDPTPPPPAASSGCTSSPGRPSGMWWVCALVVVGVLGRQGARHT